MSLTEESFLTVTCQHCLPDLLQDGTWLICQMRTDPFGLEMVHGRGVGCLGIFRKAFAAAYTVFLLRHS